MDSSLLKKLRVMLLSAAAVMALLAGCSDDGIGKRYSVTGTVNHAGKPVASGKITFKPADDKAKGSRGAYGDIKDGKYSLTTSDPNDGALVGKYQVSITDLQVDMNALKDETAEFAKKKKLDIPPGMVDPVMAAKAAKAAAKAADKNKGGIPSKYANPASSGLNAEVKAQSNTFDFDLAD